MILGLRCLPTRLVVRRVALSGAAQLRLRSRHRQAIKRQSRNAFSNDHADKRLDRSNDSRIENRHYQGLRIICWKGSGYYHSFFGQSGLAPTEAGVVVHDTPLYQQSIPT
jgi:hypothetical protein